MYNERAGTRTRGSQTLWIRSGDMETKLATDSESIFTTTSKNFSAPGLRTIKKVPGLVKPGNRNLIYLVPQSLD